MKKNALAVAGGGVRGRILSFHNISEQKINKMMQIQFQNRTEAKIKWSVNCYNNWREMRLTRPNCCLEILESDINVPASLDKKSFEYALCRFICEVKKTKNEGDYPGRTLYQMACALQNHLRKNKVNWKLLHGDEFQDFNRVLDSVMKEHAASSVGTVRKQAQVISLEFEQNLWLKGVLGEDTPDKLRNTVLYLIGVNCALRAGDEHYALRRPGRCTSSQISFEVNKDGLRCAVYHEDTVTKTNQGGLKDMKKERKVVWIKPNTNLVRCPVRIIEKYVNLLPENGSKPNFYLQSLRRTKPFCWFSTTPVGINSLRKVVSSMLRDARLDGYFTNHSLRRTCATRLYQAGQSTKMIKEITGHISDAVEKYQTTSDDQRMAASAIIQGDVNEVKLSQAEPMMVVESSKPVGDEVKFALPKLELPVSSKNDVKSEAIAEIGNIVESAVGAVGKRKAKITFQVELLD